MEELWLLSGLAGIIIALIGVFYQNILLFAIGTILLGVFLFIAFIANTC